MANPKNSKQAATSGGVGKRVERQSRADIDEETLKRLLDEFADEDIALAEAGLEEYAQQLAMDDVLPA